MSLLNFENNSSHKKKALFKYIALATIAVAVLKVSGTFAANININTGSPVQYGQGLVALTSCSGTNSITMSPASTFNSASNTFYFSGLTVSGIPSSCNGYRFTINAFANTGNLPVQVYNTNATDIVVDNYAGTYSIPAGYSGISVSSATSGSTTSFTVSFSSPVASTPNAAKFSVVTSKAPVRDLGSIYLDASSALSIGTAPVIGTGAYTAEMWLKIPTAPSGNSLIISGNYALGLYVEPNLNTFHVVYWGPGTGDHTFTVNTLTTNAWHHIALVRNSSGLTQLFIDGQASTSGSYTDSNNYNQGVNTVLAGGAGGKLAAYLSNLRIVNSNVYSPSASTITVPTSDLTAVSGTQLLLNTKPSDPTGDSSSTHSSITVSGTAQSSSQSPFN